MPHGDITHIEIPVADMGRAQQFYSTLFGWQIAAPPGFEEYPMWQAPNQISGGGLVQRDEAFTQPRSFVEVDSIEETLKLAQQNGARVVQEKAPISETSWWAIFEDPDGNNIGLYEGVTETEG